MSERAIQNLAVAMIRKIGFTVCVSSNRKRTSNTKGMPDTFIHIKGRKWIGMEFKRPEGETSLAQAKLAKANMSYVVDNVEDAIGICLKERLGK
jgi:hypothetical protein